MRQCVILIKRCLGWVFWGFLFLFFREAVMLGLCSNRLKWSQLLNKLWRLCLAYWSIRYIIHIRVCNDFICNALSRSIHVKLKKRKSIKKSSQMIAFTCTKKIHAILWITYSIQRNLSVSCLHAEHCKKNGGKVEN